MTCRMEPSEPVTTRLTVPRLVPVLVCTVSPVVRPGSVVLDTAPLARTLRWLACAIPVGDAWNGPWLTPTAGLVVVVLRFSALFGLALIEPCALTPALM